MLNKHALQHIQKSNYAYGVDKDTLCIRLRTAKDDLQKVEIVYADKFAMDDRYSKVMTCVLSDELFDYYEVNVALDQNRYVYYFKLHTEDGSVYFGENGLEEDVNEETMTYSVFQFPFLHEVDVHTAPEWSQSAVFYQIFIDRFYNGDTTNDPEELTEWGKLPGYKNYYGGDLRGIIKKLDYLQDLGITALYLTPIFDANTNHKYDTKDYLKVAPDFGTLEDLKELVQRSHEKGIRVVLDAVFNHCGYFFGPFQDVLEKGRESEYFDWFYINGDTVTQNPHNYLSFAFSPRMPKFNTANEAVQDYLLKVATYWIETCDIDGWRLDVSDEVDHVFWRRFREVVKAVKPDAIIIGENWHNAQPWLQGDQYDGVMNYAVTKACLDYIAHDHIGADKFAYTLSNILMRNTHQANDCMLNMLDSHDTERMLTLCKGNKKKVQLATTFLMNFVGMPCTYYGTEIAMAGGRDPDCRRTFEWDETKWDHNYFNYHKRIIALRNTYKSLTQGKVRFAYTKDLFVMERSFENETIVLVMNNTSDAKPYVVPAGTTKELLADKAVTADGTEHVMVQPYEAKMYYKLN